MLNVQVFLHERLNAFPEAPIYPALMPATKQSGKRLKEARIDAGLSLRELSDKTGGLYSISRLSNYEQGTRAINPQAAQVLATILGVSATHILCIQEETPGDEMTPEEHRLLRAFRALSEKDRDRELVHLEVMALPHRRPASDAQIRSFADPARRPKSKSPQK